MKVISLIILFFIFSIASVFSQHLDARAFAGVNVLQLSSDNGTTIINGVLHHRSVSGRTGYQYGAVVTFGAQFYVQPGFQYSILSTKIVNENSGTKFTDETTLKAISIPLKVGFRLINPKIENKFNVRIFGGFDGNHIIAVNHSKKSGEIDDISTSDYHNLIVNADFGMGFDFLFFFVDMGYQLGLSPVHTGADKATSNAFYSNFGIRISL